LSFPYSGPRPGGPGAHRPKRLLRPLPLEVEATVITAAPSDYEALSPLRMPLDARRFERQNETIRLPAGCPYRLFQVLAKLRLYGALRWCWVPDVARGWARAACKLAGELHAQQPFDVIFSSAPPFSTGLGGRDF